MADPVEEKLLHMVTADPVRTPTFTPFAQGDYFLRAPSVDGDAVRRQQPDLDELRLPAEHDAAAQTFAWNHGGVQPEVASTWIGWVGPGIEKSIRPTRCGPTTPTSGRRCSRCSG